MARLSEAGHGWSHEKGLEKLVKPDFSEAHMFATTAKK